MCESDGAHWAKVPLRTADRRQFDGFPEERILTCQWPENTMLDPDTTVSGGVGFRYRLPCNAQVRGFSLVICLF